MAYLLLRDYDILPKKRTRLEPLGILCSYKEPLGPLFVSEVRPFTSNSGLAGDVLSDLPAQQIDVLILYVPGP